MTREEAIEILIAVAVCDRPILSCDFCARYKGTGNGCDAPTDKEVEESVLFLKGASNDAAISALMQEEHFRDLTKKVEPLTLDDLRQMDGEPVWTVTTGISSSGRWELCTCETVCVCPLHKVLRCVTADGEVTDYDLETYGKTWLAYRQKPEENKHEQ